MIDATVGVVMDDSEIVDRTDPDSDEMIAARHFRLRGTDALRYCPPHLACKRVCGYVDNNTESAGSLPLLTNHQCFLGPEHSGDCVFSSECMKMVIRSVPNGVIEANAAVRPA